MKTFCILIATLLLAGCVYPVHNVDKFNNTTTDGFSNNNLPTGIMFVIALDPKRIVAEGTNRYFIDANFWSQGGWLFISPGESLILLIDGERLALTGLGSVNNREVSGSTVSEAARYPVTPDLFARLASAKKVEVRLVGQSKNWDGKLSAKNQQVFAQFHQKFCQ